MEAIKPYLSMIKWLAMLAAGLVIGWTANGWRLGKTIAHMEADAAQRSHQAEIDAREKESEFNQRIQEAQNAATERERSLRADSDRARNSVDQLRGQLAEIRRNLPELADDAVRQRADTLAELFGACADRYRDLAEKAGRHVSDEQKLMDSWPK